VADRLADRHLPLALVLGFVAGALAVLVFHQLTILILRELGLSQGNVYSMRPSGPLGVPLIINYMFWSGLWGCVFALIADRFPRSWPVWLTGLVFGLLGPTLVAWFVVAPLKGQEIASDFNPSRMINSAIIHGMFGIGVAVFCNLLRRWSIGPRLS